MGRKATLVQGVGVNDIPGSSSLLEDGKSCKYYRAWSGMLLRCYSEKFQLKSPSYRGVTVCDEWLTFSNFKRWMENQDWQGKQLDKDLLSRSVKIYSPETCCFVSSMVNNFVKPPAKNKDLPQGVRLNKYRMMYYAEVFNPFLWKNEKSSLFSSAADAHDEWKSMKLCIAIKLSESESDKRVVSALVRIFSSDQ